MRIAVEWTGPSTCICPFNAHMCWKSHGKSTLIRLQSQYQEALKICRHEIELIRTESSINRRRWNIYCDIRTGKISAGIILSNMPFVMEYRPRSKRDREFPFSRPHVIFTHTASLVSLKAAHTHTRPFFLPGKGCRLSLLINSWNRQPSLFVSGVRSSRTHKLFIPTRKSGGWESRKSKAHSQPAKAKAAVIYSLISISVSAASKEGVSSAYGTRNRCPGEIRSDNKSLKGGSGFAVWFLGCSSVRKTGKCRRRGTHERFLKWRHYTAIAHYKYLLK